MTRCPGDWNRQRNTSVCRRRSGANRVIRGRNGLAAPVSCTLDIGHHRTDRQVRLVPLPDSCIAANRVLFDHLSKQRGMAGQNTDVPSPTVARTRTRRLVVPSPRAPRQAPRGRGGLADGAPCSFGNPALRDPQSAALRLIARPGRYTPIL